MFQFSSLTKFGGEGALAHAMSEAKDGSMSPRFSRPGEWRVNRFSFLVRQCTDLAGGHPLFMPGNGISLRPAYTPELAAGDRDIHVATEEDHREARGMYEAATEVVAEALVLAFPGAFACLTIADCIALVLFDPERRILALGHVSRASALARLPERLAAFLKREFQVHPEDVVAAISPAIGCQSYALERFDGPDAEEWYARGFAEKRDGLVYIDLPRAALAGLLDAGLASQQIENAGLDTATARDAVTGEFRFFSHYRFSHPERFPKREREEGRNVFVAGMPPH